MPQKLKFIGQKCQDEYLQNYKGDNDFWTLEDFIDSVGNTISNFYQQVYEKQYAELRQDRKQELVIFDTGILSEQYITVERKDDELIGEIKYPVMSFLYDTQNVGFQDVLIVEPSGSNEMQRTTQNSQFELNYIGFSNTIWWFPIGLKMRFINKGSCNVKKVKLLYIPSMYPDAMIPDGLVDMAIQKTIQNKRQNADKTVIKKGLDQNQNKILETEIDRNQLK